MRVAAAILLFAAACVLLYFGSGILLLVPGVPGGPYWVRERVQYGLLPTGSGVGLLGLAAWMSIRPSPTAGRVLTRTCALFGLAAACIVAFWVLLILTARR